MKYLFLRIINPGRSGPLFTIQYYFNTTLPVNRNEIVTIRYQYVGYEPLAFAILKRNAQSGDSNVIIK